MAENDVSFERFTALPGNISSFGFTPEEVALQRGSPDPNPTLAPMATPGTTERLLALRAVGSDRMRLAQPVVPEMNPYEGPKLALVLTRSAAAKLRAAVVTHVASQIDSGVVTDRQVKARMRSSLRRVALLRDHLDRVNTWTEAVHARRAGTSKG